MTREETKKHFMSWCQGHIGNNASDEDCHMFNNIMALLEKEPCEDCVNREEVINNFEHWYSELLLNNKEETDFCDIVRKMSSVQPKIEQESTKTGHWIKEESPYGWDGKSYQCSVCRRSIHLNTEIEDLTDYPYCHCGAKMESEVEQ